MPLPIDENGQLNPAEFANSGDPWNRAQGETRGRNHLWVLQQDGEELKLAKALNNFGEPGEDIRSVRYLNSHAYIVTFKKTDPLYSIDMSNPLEAKMVGKLKIPGFSLYLHPVEGEKMIGVCFEAEEQNGFALFQGIQLSLFNIADPSNVTRTDNVIHGERGSQKHPHLTLQKRSFCSVIESLS